MPLTFFGGIKPENKKYSKSKPLRAIAPPDTVFIPLDHNFVLIVSAGDTVRAGQAVAKNGILPVYSSISGVVKGIAREGDKRYIAIENDRKNTPYEGLIKANRPLTELGRKEIFALLHNYAITDSSDGISVYEKAKDCADKQSIKRIIINCCEHDSYSTALYRLLVERPKELIGGAKILMHALEIKKCIIVIEDKKKNAVERLEKNINDTALFVSAFVQQKYPTNDRTIMSAVYGREIPHGQKASELGYIFFGAESVIQVYDSFVSGLPQINKAITVSGESITSPSNLTVPIGTPIKSLISECEGLAHRCRCVVNGGVMDGECMDTPGGVVTGLTNQILFLPRMDKYSGNCIRCGRCISVCPMHLSPLEYAVAAEKKENKAEKRSGNGYYGINACIECGCCEYICPAGVALLDIIKAAKKAKTSNRGEAIKKEDNKADDQSLFGQFL